MTKTDDLVVLLHEAKETIIQLQDDTSVLRSQVESLRQQNENYAVTIETLKDGVPVHNKCTKMSQTDDIKAPPIPLEPIVIVNKSHEKRKRKHDVKRGETSTNIKVYFQIFSIFKCYLIQFYLQKMPNLDVNSITTDESQSLIDAKCSDSDDDTYVV